MNQLKIPDSISSENDRADTSGIETNINLKAFPKKDL